jgi:hypothetical protein
MRFFGLFFDDLKKLKTTLNIIELSLSQEIYLSTNLCGWRILPSQ